LAGAKETLPRADHVALDRVNAWLGGSAEEAPAARPGAQPQQGQNGGPPGHSGSARRTAQILFSQLTAPVAAKAVEDTACYRYGRLLSR
ncbi:hypothetical protein SB763_33490, partial [Burkholderia sp. SIMBA_042]|uniref:hypothetical protein n=1 Tax=Burkholderia sp. SIMBA_042 TaxID=3085783 RepID=UPI00397CED23